jgi:hypothetical protein
MKWFNSTEVRFKYVNLIIAKYELNGRSRINYDENFYLDYETNIQKFFSQQNLIKFGRINRLAFHLFKNEKFWRFWKNCVRLILSSIGMICLGFIRVLVGRL